MTTQETLSQLCRECRVHSGGFHRHPLYGVVVAAGKEAVPLLLAHLVKPDADDDAHPWVVMSLLRTIVGDDSPEIPPSERGRLDPLRRRWIEWGAAR
jgi:hypothetical protein